MLKKELRKTVPSLIQDREKIVYYDVITKKPDR